MYPLVDLPAHAVELHGILRRVKGEIDVRDIALHVAEEVGECIGASNKMLEHRGTIEHFALEWSQAMIMLTMLGQHYLPDDAQRSALAREMQSQRLRWAQR